MVSTQRANVSSRYQAAPFVIASHHISKLITTDESNVLSLSRDLTNVLRRKMKKLIGVTSELDREI